MKRLLALLLVAGASAANAGEIRSTITDSVQLTVEGPAVQSTRIGSQYTVSGSNITATDLGGLSAGSATAPAVRTTGDYEVTTDGEAFSFSEYDLTGDVPVTSQSNLSNNGRFDAPNLYGTSVTSIGGSAGTLAGTLSATGVPTVTAGGPGTTAIGQRSVELSVFQ